MQEKKGVNIPMIIAMKYEWSTFFTPAVVRELVFFGANFIQTKIIQVKLVLRKVKRLPDFKEYYLEIGKIFPTENSGLVNTYMHSN